MLDAGDYEAALTELLRIADYDGLSAGGRLPARRQAIRHRDCCRHRALRLEHGVYLAGADRAGPPSSGPQIGRQCQRHNLGRSQRASHAALVQLPERPGTCDRCSTDCSRRAWAQSRRRRCDHRGGYADERLVDRLGNYSNRFAAIVVDAVAQCAEQVAHKIKLLAADALDVSPEEIELHDGYARVRGQSNKGLPFRRAAARAHWDPAGLPDNTSPGIHEAAIVSPRVLASSDDEDRIASAVTFGFVIDLAAIEIDRKTGAIRVDKYASVHDVGAQLNPKVVEGQVHGGFTHGFGAALFEELAYDAQGNFLSGTFADYLCPTAAEIPKIDIGHVEHAPRPMRSVPRGWATAAPC